MRVAKAMPRILGAASLLLFGPLLGILIALVAAALSLTPDPNFEANGGHAAPGDGFLIMGCMLGSLVVFVPLSLAGAVWILFFLPARFVSGHGFSRAASSAGKCGFSR